MRCNGIAHTQLTVSNFEKCLPFYKGLLQGLEMTLIYEDDNTYYCVGSRTGVAITRCAPEFKNERFQQYRIGLHHLCFRMYEREDVDKVYELVKNLGAKIIRAPIEENFWAPGYYSVLFEDPDGIRLEANHIPGKGNLDADVKLPKEWK